MHPTIGCFGKLQGHGDFIQAGAAGELPQELRSWVEAGLARAVTRPSFVAEFDAGVPYAFFFRSKVQPRQALCGVLAPSRDTVGRRFPLVVHAQVAVEPFEAFPHLAPLALGRLLESVALGVRGALEDGQGRTLLTALNAVEGPELGAVLSDAQAYTRWAQASSMEQALAWLFEAISPAETLRALGLIQAASEGQAPGQSPIALRFPLGAAGAVGAALWGDLVRRIAGWSHFVPSCFWSVSPTSSTLLLHLGTVLPASFGELWSAPGAHEHVCDFTQPGLLSSAQREALSVGQVTQGSVFELLCSL